MEPSCCTCAALLSSVPRQHPDTEKPLPEHRQVPCCERIICGRCIYSNNRFAHYCPYCQVSTGPSSLFPSIGTKEPPAYTSLPTRAQRSSASSGTSTPSNAPPPYTPVATVVPTSTPPSYAAFAQGPSRHAKARPKSKSKANAADFHDRHLEEEAAAGEGEDGDDEVEEDEEELPPDTLHFLNHEHDSIASLSLRYRVPAAALRRANNLTSDHLLVGRRTILIPSAYYKGGVSLSPRPVEGEEEELRKSKIRRFMTTCKVFDYDVALLYLEQTGYELAEAVEAYLADEAWEREHPLAQGSLAAGSRRRGGPLGAGRRPGPLGGRGAPLLHRSGVP